jgi:hypothetical protein
MKVSLDGGRLLNIGNAGTTVSESATERTLVVILHAPGFFDSATNRCL